VLAEIERSTVREVADGHVTPVALACVAYSSERSDP
jgi:hypothetical protein